jgi:hypothetical protein
MQLKSRPNIKDELGRTQYWCKLHEEYFLNECPNCIGELGY